MTVRRFEVKDFPMIAEWGRQWGAEYNADQFPATGFIIDDIAAYFLYATDSSVCWLENMISRKGVPEAIKERALKMLVEACLEEAKAQGFTVAYATTDIVPVAKLAREYGAGIKTHQFLITKNLLTQLQ